MKRLLRSGASAAATYGLMALGVVGYLFIRIIVEVKDAQLRDEVQAQQRQRRGGQ